MTDRDRLWRRVAYGLVALWGVVGFVLHLVRGVNGWLALAVSGGLVVVAVLVMTLVPRLFRRTAPPPPVVGPAPGFDPQQANADDLMEFALEVSHRIRTWAGSDLDDTARTHAEQARTAIDKIVELMEDKHLHDQLTGSLLRTTRLILLKIKVETSARPDKAIEWYELKGVLDAQHVRLLGAVNSAG